MKQLILLLSLLLFCTASMMAQRKKNKKDKSNSSQTLVVKTTGKKQASNKKDVKIIWIAPERNATLTDKVLVKVIIEAEEEIDADKISVLLNNTKAGAKADVINFKKMSSAKKQFNYENIIELKEGKNKIEIAVEQQDGTVKKSYAKVLMKAGENITELVQSGNNGGKGIYWERPQWSSNPVVVDERQFKMRVLINSPSEIKKSDIYILRKGIQKILPAPDSKLIKKSEGRYEFTNTLQLSEEGINEVMVKIRSAVAGEMKSEPLMLNFTPHRPNIHLLAVGTQTNLDYTMKDAGDFAACFEGQAQAKGGQLFNVVNTNVLVGKDASASAIKTNIEKLEASYKNGAIGKKDLILIYISSHGFLDEKRRLRIQGDDYDPGAPRTTSVSYERDIVEVLEAIPCKKLVFIDACYSGGSKSNNEDVDYQLEELNKVLKGFTTVVSSKGDEASYEDAVWENGAFTEAILEGLLLKRANKDGNQFITINELWYYLQERVPDLVSKVKKKAQHPSLKKNDLGDVAIYYVN